MCGMLATQRAVCTAVVVREDEAAVFVNEKKWLWMHVHVQLRLDEHSCIHA
jgi:hypothetical protein